MPQKLEISEVHRRISMIHGDQIVLDERSYVNVRTKARFVDNELGEWWTLPKSIMNGCKHPKRAKNAVLSINEVKRRLIDVHEGVVTIVESTYSGVGRFAIFIDCEFGHWQALPYNVLYGHSHPKRGRQKCEQTCIHKYGVSNVMMCPDILKKSRFKRNQIRQLIHWRTGECLMCRGSYETAFVNWCNYNRVDFDWQIPFKMPSGKTYVVDAYIKSGLHENRYIEIKGFWYDDDAKNKWLWFKDQHPRSELWMKSDLIRVGILSI